MSSNYDVICIGSGLGGLTAAALSAKRGMKVLVLERHTQFGGAATVFHRKGLRVEVGLHEMDGLDSIDPKASIFRSLELDQDLQFLPVGNFFGLRAPWLQQEYVMPEGVESAVRTAIEHFPDQERSIKAYFKTICRIRRCMSRYKRANKTILWWLFNGPVFPFLYWPLLKYEKETVGGLLRRLFGDREDVKLALCANLLYYSQDPEELSLLFFSAAQGGYHEGGGYYLKGGSQVLSDRLVEIVRQHGGEVVSRREVTRTLVEDNRAIGVEHERAGLIASGNPPRATDRLKAFAPVIFGNAAPNVLARTLPERLRSAFLKPYQRFKPSPSLWTVYLEFNRPPSEFGVTQYSTFVYPAWMRTLSDTPAAIKLLGAVPTEKTPPFVFVDYSRVDANLSSRGSFFGVICGLDDGRVWKSLSEYEYRERKSQWEAAIVGALDHQYPGIRASIIYKEMATAKTVERYLGTPDGAVYGFSQQPLSAGRFRPSSKTALKGLWLASAFAFPGGGFTGAMLAGEAAVEAVFGREKIPGIGAVTHNH